MSWLAACVRVGIITEDVEEVVRLRGNSSGNMSSGRVEEVGDCDHIVPTYKGGKTVLSNLQWLCRNPCHRDKSDRESKEAQGAKVTVPIGTDGWPL